MLKNAIHHPSLQQVIILLLVDGLKYCENYHNVTEEHELSKYCWKNGTGKTCPGRVATNLQFVKKQNKTTTNKQKTLYEAQESKMQ